MLAYARVATAYTRKLKTGWRNEDIEGKLSEKPKRLKKYGLLIKQLKHRLVDLLIAGKGEWLHATLESSLVRRSCSVV